jgi:hypothetical protein
MDLALLIPPSKFDTDSDPTTDLLPSNGVRYWRWREKKLGNGKLPKLRV